MPAQSTLSSAPLSERTRYRVLLPNGAIRHLRSRAHFFEENGHGIFIGAEWDVTADVLLLHGWPDAPPDYVHRRLGGSRSLIVAAPEHWAAHGVPASG